MIEFIPKDERKAYLVPALSVLYRSAEESTLPGKEAANLRVLAKEIMEHLSSSVELSAYLEVYNNLHKSVKAVQEERRVKRKIQAVVDPVAATRRKAQKIEMKKAGRKRKAEELAKWKPRSGRVKRVKQSDV